MCKLNGSGKEVQLAMSQLQKLVEHVEFSICQWEHVAGPHDGNSVFSTAIRKAQELRQSLVEIQRQIEDEVNTDPPKITVKLFT